MKVDRRFLFWQRWLLVVCAGSVLVGLFLAFFPHSAVMASYNSQIAKAFYDSAAFDTSQARHHAWSMAVLGSSVAGWGLTLTLVVATAFREQKKWAWWCFALAVPLWVVIDSTASWRAGVWLETVFNVTFLVLVALPLAFTRRFFFD